MGYLQDYRSAFDVIVPDFETDISPAVGTRFFAGALCCESGRVVEVCRIRAASNDENARCLPLRRT
jgi:hypothetical protein